MKGGNWRLGIFAALLASAVPAIAGAQDARADGERGPLARYGSYVLLGGGVTDFTDDAVKDRFDAGGAWDLRVGVGSRSFVGGELAYVGSFRSGSAAGLDLLTNGAEGVLRLQYPYAVGAWLVEPFAFGGIGWSRLSLQDAPPGVEDSDDAGFVPFGAGITVGWRRLLLDARFTYRTSFNEPESLGLAGGSPDLDQWAVGASIGYEF